MNLLLVDDDEQWLKKLTESCQTAGFSCTAVADPTQALTLYCQNPQDYDVIVADLTMPGLTGNELVRKIHEFDPEARVIMMSACQDYSLIAQAAGNHIESFLLKPVQLDELMELLHKISDELAQKNKETAEKESLVKEYIKLRREYGEAQVLIKKYETLLDYKKE